MKKFAFAAAAIAATVATPAFAQDAQDAKPLTLYVGPVVGWDHAQLSDGTNTVSDDGVLYGVSFGADYSLSPSEGMFVGLEGEYSGSGAGKAVDSALVPGDTLSIYAGRNLYAGVRLGSAIGKTARVYVKGGYSNATIKGTYFDTAHSYTANENLDGWLVGAGVEAKVSPALLRLEYRYTDYGDVNVDGHESGISASRHQVVAAALFSF